MDITEHLAMSYFKDIATLNEEHCIYLVQNLHTGKIYVKKILDVYNPDIFLQLKDNPVKYTPKIYELFEEDSRLTVIEEYIPGDTLEEMLESGRRFNNNEIRDIALKLCCIVDELHSSKPAIIHRDIKPSNIILTPSGEVVLLDLNAAKSPSHNKYEDTRLLGTKGYAAPEQYGFGSSDTQTDIYAIGMLINTLVLGKFSPELCRFGEFAPIIKKCTQLKAQDRYKKVSDIIYKLDTKTIIRHNRNKSWQSFLPPGYRTLNPANMIIATVGYAFIIWMCCSMTIGNSTRYMLTIERLAFAFITIGTIFITANYRDVQRFFSLCRNSNPFLHVLGIILLDILYIISVFLIMIILAYTFS